MQEVELAARLFHSANIDELMACLHEHPAPSKTHGQSPAALRRATSHPARPITPDDAEARANRVAPHNDRVRSGQPESISRSAVLFSEFQAPERS